jgi:hypothetical protein
MTPFEVLGLPPTADEAAVVERAAALCRKSGDEDAKARYREAARMLTTSAEERAMWALRSFPGADYENKELDRFVAANRRPPASSAEPRPVPPPDEGELREWLLTALAAELEPTPRPFAPVPAGETADEIARQSAEALWQGAVGPTGG